MKEEEFLDAIDRAKAFGFAEGMRLFKPRELSFEDIQQIYKEAFGWEITNPKDNWVLLAREIEKRIKDAQKI